MSIIQIFSDLGLKSSISKYISEYKERGSSQLPHIIYFGFTILLLLLIISSIILYISTGYLSQILGEPKLDPFLVVGVFYIISNSLFEFLQKIFQGFEDIDRSSLIGIIKTTTRFIVAIGLVLSGFGALGAFFGYAISGTIGFIVGLIIFYREYGDILKVKSGPEPGLKKKIVMYSIPVTATTAGRKIDTRFDTILIGFFLNPSSVGIYTVSKQIVSFIQTPAKSLGFTLGPAFGAKKSSGDLETASKIFENALINILLFYIPATAGIILVAEPTIILIFGEEYSDAIPVLQLLGLYLLLMATNQMVSNALHYLGRARSSAMLRSTTAILNLALNVILIPTYGVIGAAIATVITFSIYTIGQIYVAHKEIKFRFRPIIKNLLSIFLVTGIMSGVVAFLSSYIEGYLSLFFVVGVGVLIWITCSVILGLLDINQLYNKFK
jgi:O-antigen/teichoic acid export membrane protein